MLWKGGNFEALSSLNSGEKQECLLSKLLYDIVLEVLDISREVERCSQGREIQCELQMVAEPFVSRFSSNSSFLHLCAHLNVGQTLYWAMGLQWWIETHMVISFELTVQSGEKKNMQHIDYNFKLCDVQWRERVECSDRDFQKKLVWPEYQG